MTHSGNASSKKARLSACSSRSVPLNCCGLFGWCSKCPRHQAAGRHEMIFAPGETTSPSTLRVASPTPIVFVVDDDASVRESLEPLILSYGFDVATFATAEEFLRRPSARVPSCLLLDMRLPDLSGFEVQGRFAAQGQRMPIVFITGYGDVATTVRAMKAGALEVLTKPLREDLLVAAIREAIDRSNRALVQETEARTLRERYALLSR